jgi:hypothetical protein
MSVSVDRHSEWTASQWFTAAVRCFLEEHQGCPCCRQRHCVFRSQWGTRTEYHCTACDFSASHDSRNGICWAAPAVTRKPAPPGGDGLVQSCCLP